MSSTDRLASSTHLSGELAALHDEEDADDSAPVSTFLEFVEERNDDTQDIEDLDFGLRLLETRRDPVDDPIFESLETLLTELAEERPKAPSPLDYDKMDERIILSTFNKALSPAQIHRVTGITITEVYRRIRKLESLHLVKHVRTLMVTRPRERLVKFYRTNVKKVNLLVEEGQIRLGIKFRRIASRPQKVSILVDTLAERA